MIRGDKELLCEQIKRTAICVSFVHDYCVTAAEEFGVFLGRVRQCYVIRQALFLTMWWSVRVNNTHVE